MIWGVLQFPGSCDERDAVAACERAGDARLVWHDDGDVSDCDAIVVPGGFSYGDYLRAGAIARFSKAMEAVAARAAEGMPVLGICNGFQVLCESGLLPGALLTNENLHFVCRQVTLEVAESRCLFTSDLAAGSTLSIPAKHQSGRFYAPASQLADLERNGQIVLRYGAGQNPNGSLGDIAGVCNEAGNVMGLMPHPEHAVDPLTGSTDGLLLFQGAASALASA